LKHAFVGASDRPHGGRDGQKTLSGIETVPLRAFRVDPDRRDGQKTLSGIETLPHR